MTYVGQVEGQDGTERGEQGECVKISGGGRDWLLLAPVRGRKTLLLTDLLHGYFRRYFRVRCGTKVRVLERRVAETQLSNVRTWRKNDVGVERG